MANAAHVPPASLGARAPRDTLGAVPIILASTPLQAGM
jgi:hypothetical protein